MRISVPMRRCISGCYSLRQSCGHEYRMRKGEESRLRRGMGISTSTRSSIARSMVKTMGGCWLLGQSLGKKTGGAEGASPGGCGDQSMRVSALARRCRGTVISTPTISSMAPLMAKTVGMLVASAIMPPSMEPMMRDAPKAIMV